MEKFKGSKSPWILEDVEILNQDGELIAGVYGEFHDKLYQYTEVSYANVLLMSKAPEMLEMLEYIYLSYEKDGHLLNVSPSKIKQLIKEATEL